MADLRERCDGTCVDTPEGPCDECWRAIVRGNWYSFNRGPKRPITHTSQGIRIVDIVANPIRAIRDLPADERFEAIYEIAPREMPLISEALRGKLIDRSRFGKWLAHRSLYGPFGAVWFQVRLAWRWLRGFRAS